MTLRRNEGRVNPKRRILRTLKVLSSSAFDHKDHQKRKNVRMMELALIRTAPGKKDR